MKKISAFFKELPKRSKVLSIIALIVVLLGLGSHMFTTLKGRSSKKNTEVPTASESLTEMTTSAPSTEDISATVSEMVESQSAEMLAEMNSTPTAEPTEDGNANVSEGSSITFLQGNDSYTVSCMFSADEALSYSTFCKNSGRDVYVQVPDYVTSISISISFRDVDNNLSEFSDFEELDLMQTENGTEAQYSIPDNPLRDDGYYEYYARFFGVFRLDTTEGCEYFAISY